MADPKKSLQNLRGPQEQLQEAVDTLPAKEKTKTVEIVKTATDAAQAAGDTSPVEQIKARLNQKEGLSKGEMVALGLLNIIPTVIGGAVAGAAGAAAGAEAGIAATGTLAQVKGQERDALTKQLQAAQELEAKQAAAAQQSSERREYKERELDLRRQALAQSKEQSELNRNFREEGRALLSDKEVAELSDIDKSLSVLNRIKAEKPNINTGPASAAQSWAAQLVGMDDSEKSAFKALVGDQLAQYIKSISGAAVSEQEAQRLLQNIPKISDQDETFTTKLAELEKTLREGRQIRTQNLRRRGKDVSQFQAPASGSSEGQKQVTRTGRTKDGKKVIEYSDGTREIQ